MPDYYVDFNRGSDSNAGTSSALPWKNLSKISALSAAALPAGCIINLRDDSIWDLQETLSANNFLGWNNFQNGASGSPITIASYGGVDKPKISYTMVPQAAWWTWDATVGAWYLELATAIWGRGGFGVIVGGTYAISAGGGMQAGAASVINTIVGTNGVTIDTLRWVVPAGGTRLYVAGGGIGPGVDPTTYYGYGNVIIYPSAPITGWQSFVNTHIDGIEFAGGGILYLTYGAGTLNIPGTEIRNCSGSGLGGIVQTVANTTATDSLIEVNVYDNDFSNITRMGVYLTGPITGRTYRNRFSHGNLCQSAGGFVYMQIKRNTGGHAVYSVEDNYAEYATHGVGERQFDGSCYYADAGDDGTQFLRNVAAHSFKGYQLNSGKQNLLAANVAFDCCKFGTFTDAEAVGASDYTLVHNLWVSSMTPDSYPHGAADNANSAFSLWCNIGSTITGAKLQNNMLVVRGSGWSNTVGILAYPTTMWTGAGVSGLTIDTNAVIGGQISKYITASNDTTDKSSIYLGTVIGSGAGVGYLNGLPSGLASLECLNTGTDTQIAGLVDFNGNAFQAIPSIGAFEPQTLARCI
ncbi:MAG: hypothetical protein IE917_10850 [Betaproteobacteria bacterium]|nr:hypothetical protein [Betaproteobacteria bacterium]